VLHGGTPEGRKDALPYVKDNVGISLHKMEFLYRFQFRREGGGKTSDDEDKEGFRFKKKTKWDSSAMVFFGGGGSHFCDLAKGAIIHKKI